MKNVAFFPVLLISILFDVSASVQGFSNSDNIGDIAVYGDYIWCATDNGIIRWDTRDTTKVKYDTSDGLASYAVNSIAVYANGVVWAGTGRKGTSRFDGTTWETFVKGEKDENDHVSDIII